MSDALTAKEIADEIRGVRSEILRMVESFKAASVDHLGAERAYKRHEAATFLEAKANGATDEMAKRIALVESEELKEVMDNLAAEKAAARLGSETWQAFMDCYSALSHALNRELKWHQAS